MAIEIVDFPIQNGWIFHSKLLVYQRVYPISPNSSGQFTGKHRTEPGPGGPGHLKTHCFRRGANGTSNLKGPRVWRRRGCAPCFFECYHGPGSKFNPQLGVISKLVGGFNHLEKISQWEGLCHMLWKIKNVWNHQPVNLYILLIFVFNEDFISKWCFFVLPMIQYNPINPVQQLLSTNIPNNGAWCHGHFQFLDNTITPISWIYGSGS